MVCLILLMLSVGLKVAVFGREPTLDQSRLGQDIEAALRARGYSTAIEYRPYFPPIITAMRGSCTIKVRDSSFVGQEMVGGNNLRLASAGPVRTLYAGRYVARHPALLPELRWRIQRELTRLGVDTSITPVLRVAARPACLPPPLFADRLQLWMR